MSEQIKLYYKNATDEIIGSEHGLSLSELESYQANIADIIGKINEQTQAGKLMYRKLPENIEMADKAQQLANKFRDKCDNLVVLGIGGSALGTIALQTALNHPFHNLLDNANRNNPRLFVMDNVDPVQFSGLLELLENQLDRTIFNVISKSGETAETASQFLIIRNLIREKLGEENLAKHIVVTTDAQSGTLRKIADSDGYDALEVPAGVGGRFSVLSHVGLFPAAMCGVDIYQLLEGARDMNARVSNDKLFENPAALFALIQFLFYQKGKPMSVFMPYSYQLKDLSDWFRQLWAESLGKNKTLDGKEVFVGPTPIKALGATDQHSQVQLYREGPNDKVITFLEVEQFDKCAEIPNELPNVESINYLSGKTLAQLINNEKVATEYALAASLRPSLTILFPRITPYSVGQFILMLEMATSVAGELFYIDAYNQPAVELGKKATFALMGRPGYEQLKSELTPFIKRDERFLV